MSLTVKIGRQSYEFVGPFTSTDSLESKSGAYVVTTVNSTGTHTVLDAGESGNVKERLANHDRADCWEKNQQTGLNYSAYYCTETERMKLEKELRDAYNPPCGDR